LLDLTTDLGIPVYAAVSAARDGNAVAIGAAAHFDANRAAIAALTEMAQIEFSLEMRQTLGAGGSDAFGSWLDTVTFDSAPHLVPRRGSRHGLPDSGAAGPATVENCLDICRGANMRFLTVDLTRPAVGVPVVRVMVPGLRPTRARFAPGRLFDAPAKAGWCDRSPTLAELNPVPLSI
jgi:ribosomal protein S12 methylthiotransferase accessory factor